MNTDQGTVVLRRFSDGLHGATLLTLHCGSARPGRPFGTDVVARLASDGLLGQVLWSTSCTPRDVDAADFQRLHASGLYLVRIELTGIAGDPARLRELVIAVQTLRRIGLLVSYDLDLFDGSPRFASVRDNLTMLRAIVADGTIPATFRIGTVGAECSPWLRRFHDGLGTAVDPWIGAGGLAAQLADAWADVIVGERLLVGLRGTAAHRIALQRLTLRTNLELLDLVGNSARDYETVGGTPLLAAELIGPRVAGLTDSMIALRNRFLDTNASALLGAGVRH